MKDKKSKSENPVKPYGPGRLEDQLLSDISKIVKNRDRYCIDCKHAHVEEEDFIYDCDAFPDGIPAVLADGVERHDRPRPDLGQKNDIVFGAPRSSWPKQRNSRPVTPSSRRP